MPSHTILVVEHDDLEFVRIAEIIEDQDPSVRVLRSPTLDDALALLLNANDEGLELNQQPISFVLANMDGPGMFGLHFLQRMKSDERTSMVPVIIMTGAAVPSIVQRAYQLGSAGFIVRDDDDPELRRQSLAAMIEYWLNVVADPDGSTANQVAL